MGVSVRKGAMLRVPARKDELSVDLVACELSYLRRVLVLFGTTLMLSIGSAVAQPR